MSEWSGGGAVWNVGRVRTAGEAVPRLCRRAAWPDTQLQGARGDPEPRLGVGGGGRRLPGHDVRPPAAGPGRRQAHAPVSTQARHQVQTETRRCTYILTSVLFCSLAVVDPRVGHTMDAYFLHLSLSSVILIDSSAGSPVYVLMLSIQAVCGLPRLCSPGIVPYLLVLNQSIPRRTSVQDVISLS